MTDVIGANADTARLVGRSPCVRGTRKDSI